MTQDGWAPAGYRIDRMIGRGGFATVYEARQESLDRPVAVKVLMADLDSPAHRRRFDRERDILSTLSEHPHVVDVYDAGVSPDGRPFIVMRLYRRGNLGQRAGRGGLPPAEVADVVRKIASALDAAHAIGVLHRDVKPENVLITDQGEPVLSDFGISAIVAADSAATRQKSTRYATPAHCAPEVLEGGADSVASDVYALASTTYQLLAGRCAFDGGDVRALAESVVAPPPPIGRPDVPAAVEAVVLQGMAKDPAQRYRTAGEFAQALVRAVDAGAADAVTAPSYPPPPTVPGEYPTVRAQYPPPPPGQYPPPPPGQYPPPVRSPQPGRGAGAAPSTRAANRRPVLVAVAIGAVLVVGVVLGAAGILAGWWPKTRATGSASSTVPTSPAAASGLPGADVTSSGAGSPSGGSAGDGSAATSAGRSAQDAMPPALTPRSTITTGATWAASVAFQPNGNLLAAPATKGKVGLWDARTGQSTTVLAGEAYSNTSYVTFSPDGSLVAGAGAGARIWPSTGGAAKALKNDFAVGGLPGLAVFGGRGTYLATAGVNGRTVQWWNAATGAPIGSHDAGANVRALAVTPDGRTVLALTEKRVAVLDMGSGVWGARPAAVRSITFTSPISYGAGGLAVSPDGATVATGSPTSLVQLWDLATGTSKASYDGGPVWQNASATQLAFSPDGARLAAADTGRVSIWDLASGHAEYVLTVNTSYHRTVAAIAFSPDSRTLATAEQGAGSVVVQLWSLP